MPIVGSSSYSTAEYVLNLTRGLIDDVNNNDLLPDTNPAAFIYLNSAYRYLQDELFANGVKTLEKETILTGIAPVSTIDPGMQVFIYDQGYNNGTANFSTPALPTDLRIPLRLWERQSGTLSRFYPMAQVNDGLPSEEQSSTLRLWEYRTDGIYMLGATQKIDIRLRYAAYLPDLTDGTSTVQIRGAENALSALTAAEFSAARGSPLADSFRNQAMEFIEQIVDYAVKLKQRGIHRRAPYGRTGPRYY